MERPPGRHLSLSLSFSSPSLPLSSSSTLLLPPLHPPPPPPPPPPLPPGTKRPLSGNYSISRSHSCASSLYPPFFATRSPSLSAEGKRGSRRRRRRIRNQWRRETVPQVGIKDAYGISRIRSQEEQNEKKTVQELSQEKGGEREIPF